MRRPTATVPIYSAPEHTTRIDLRSAMERIRHAKEERDAWEADVGASLAGLDTWVLEDLVHAILRELGKREDRVPIPDEPRRRRQEGSG